MAKKPKKKKRKAEAQKKKKQKQKKTKEEGKAEITIGFEPHRPQMVKKMKKEMKEADMIISETNPKTIEEVKEAKTEKELKKLAKEKSRQPEHTEKVFKALKKMMGEGKKIKGVRGTRYAPAWDVLGLKKAANLKGEGLREREKERARKLKRIIRENPGKKIYIQAGARHTPIYHKLKGELGEKKSIEIKRKYLGKKDLHEKAGYPERIKKVDEPLQQLVNHFRYNTKTAQRFRELERARLEKKNPVRWFGSKEGYKKARQAEKKLEKLEEQHKKFQKTWKERKQEKMDSGMSEEKAEYEADLEAFKEMREKKEKELKEKRGRETLEEKKERLMEKGMSEEEADRRVEAAKKAREKDKNKK